MQKELEKREKTAASIDPELEKRNREMDYLLMDNPEPPRPRIT